MFRVDVSDAVGDEKYQLTNAVSRSTLFDEHFRTGGFQCSCDVRVSAVDFKDTHSSDHAVDVRVVVQMENDVRFVAELHHADPCQLR